MRIGIDARFYGSLGKGLGRYTERLIESLEERDEENEYVVFLRQENFDEYHPKSDRFKKVLADYDWYSFSEQLLFPWVLLWYHLDLVHFPHFNVPILYPGRFVVTIHDLILLRYPTIRNTTRFALWYWMKFVLYRVVIRTACFRARAVVTVSRFTESDLIREFPFLLGKTSVALEGSNQSCFITTYAEALSVLKRSGITLQNTGTEYTDGVSVMRRDIIQPYFLYVGNAYPHKHLEAIGALAARFPEYQFVFVGREDYFYRRLKQKFSSSNLCFVGYLSDAELSVLYRYGTAYIFPSLYEGFGLPPLEAMSYGLPVLSSDRASLPEILGGAALYFDPEDIEDFSSKIRLIATDTVLQDRYRTEGYRRIRMFDWRRMAKRTLRVYQSAVSPILMKEKQK